MTSICESLPSFINLEQNTHYPNIRDKVRYVALSSLFVLGTVLIAAYQLKNNDFLGSFAAVGMTTCGIGAFYLMAKIHVIVSHCFAPIHKTWDPKTPFGVEEWDNYFSLQVPQAPLLKGWKEIMEKPCPYWSGKTIADTHLMILLPNRNVFRPMSLVSDCRSMILDDHYNSDDYEGKSSEWDIFPTQQPIDASISSYWFLITREPIPRALLESRGKRAHPVTAPSINEALACQLIQRISPGDISLSETVCCPDSSGFTPQFHTEREVLFLNQITYVEKNLGNHPPPVCSVIHPVVRFSNS